MLLFPKMPRLLRTTKFLIALYRGCRPRPDGLHFPVERDRQNPRSCFVAGLHRLCRLALAEVGLGIAIPVEFAGGIALIIGYRTRLVATVLALFSIATALLFDSAFGDQNQLIHFFKNFAMAGGLLQVAAFGAGPIAIDSRR